MTEHITGRQARELLDDTTPGPWTATEDHIMRVGWEQRERERSPWEDDDPTPWLADESDHVLMNPGSEWKPLTENRADMLLAAAAPELAETVAWLYGAEMITDSWGDVEWRRHGGDGNLTLETDRYVEVETFLSDEGGPLVYVTTGPYGETVKLNADEAVEMARALLAAAEVARHQDD